MRGYAVSQGIVSSQIKQLPSVNNSCREAAEFEQELLGYEITGDEHPKTRMQFLEFRSSSIGGYKIKQPFEMTTATAKARNNSILCLDGLNITLLTLIIILEISHGAC